MNLIKQMLIAVLVIATQLNAVNKNQIMAELDSAFKNLFLQQDPLRVFSGKSPFSDKNSPEMQAWSTAINSIEKFIKEPTFFKRTSMIVEKKITGEFVDPVLRFDELKKVNDQIIDAIPQALSHDKAVAVLKESSGKLKQFSTDHNDLIADFAQKLFNGSNSYQSIAEELKINIDKVLFLVDLGFLPNYTKEKPEPIMTKNFEGEFIKKTTELLRLIDKSEYSTDYRQLLETTKELVKDINTLLLARGSYNKELYQGLYYRNLESFDFVYEQMKNKCKIVAALDLKNNQRNYSVGNPLQKLIDSFSKKLLKICRIYLPQSKGEKISYETIPTEKEEAAYNTFPPELLALREKKYQETQQQKQSSETGKEPIRYFNVEVGKEPAGAGPYHTTSGTPPQKPRQKTNQPPKTSQHHQDIGAMLAELGITRGSAQPNVPEAKGAGKEEQD